MANDKIYSTDCLVGMRELTDESVDLVVTSPPYNLNINYTSYKDNLSPTDYFGWMDEIASELKRVLKPTGSVFLNVGYSNIHPWIAMDVANVFRKHFVLQNHINWVKSISVDGKTRGHFKPINSVRYITPTWESLFQFTKSGMVPLDRLAVGVPYEFYEGNLRNPKTAATKPNLRCKGNSWFVPYETLNSKSLKGNHPAVFPTKLAEDCIALSGVRSGVLLDPFMGTGSSAVAAIRKGISYIGYEIDKEYLRFAENRISEERSKLA